MIKLKSSISRVFMMLKRDNIFGRNSDFMCMENVCFEVILLRMYLWSMLMTACYIYRCLRENLNVFPFACLPWLVWQCSIGICLSSFFKIYIFTSYEIINFGEKCLFFWKMWKLFYSQYIVF